MVWDLPGFLAPICSGGPSKGNMCLSISSIQLLPRCSVAWPLRAGKGTLSRLASCGHTQGAFPLAAPQFMNSEGRGCKSSVALRPAPQHCRPWHFPCHLHHVPKWLSCDSRSGLSAGLNSWLMVTFCSLVTSEAMIVDLRRSSMCTDRHSPVKNTVTGALCSLAVSLCHYKPHMPAWLLMSICLFYYSFCVHVYVYVCAHMCRSTVWSLGIELIMLRFTESAFISGPYSWANPDFFFWKID